jgi:hypothetical protein
MQLLLFRVQKNSDVGRTFIVNCLRKVGKDKLRSLNVDA